MNRIVAGAPAAAVLFTIVASCGGKSPTSPQGNVTSVQVGISGNATPTLAPGETRQLFATATRSNGVTEDVTNAATWQSSNPDLGTVNSSGVFTASAEGPVDVHATFSNVRGTLRLEVRRIICDVTVSPPSATYNAFGGKGTVNVTASHTSCRWTARSDVSWFPFTFDPERAGDASFEYNLPPNSTPDRRNARIIVESSTGAEGIHAIAQYRPAGCSYVTQPAELTFTAAGGTGQFNVVTTPADCRWNAINTLADLGVFLTSGFSGTGNATVRYTVQAHTRTLDADGYIEIAGLSGLNPNGRHRVVLQRR